MGIFSKLWFFLVGGLKTKGKRNYGLVPKFYDEGMKLFSLGGGVFVVASF